MRFYIIKYDNGIMNKKIKSAVKMALHQKPVQATTNAFQKKTQIQFFAPQKQTVGEYFS